MQAAEATRWHVDDAMDMLQLQNKEPPLDMRSRVGLAQAPSCCIIAVCPNVPHALIANRCSHVAQLTHVSADTS